MDIVNNLLLPAANVLEAEVITLRFILCLLLAYPLSFIHSKLPNAYVKHIYSIFFGVFFMVFVYGPWGWIHNFITGAVTYDIGIFST